MKVYIQQFNKEFMDDWQFAAYLGFRNLGADIRFFEKSKEIPYSPDKVVVGYIEDTIDYLTDAGITIPRPLNIPESLNEYYFLQREVEVKSLGQFLEGTELPIFVKPHSRVKEFASGVIKHTSSRSELFHGLSNDMEVMTSEVVEMISEYRCFVHKGELVGIKHYSGDFTSFPDIRVIDEAIKRYKDAPMAYSIDFAIVPTFFLCSSASVLQYKTVLIECNDFWSVGHYGLDETTYAKMLRDRWFEIIKG